MDEIVWSMQILRIVFKICEQETFLGFSFSHVAVFGCESTHSSEAFIIERL